MSKARTVKTVAGLAVLAAMTAAFFGVRQCAWAAKLQMLPVTLSSDLILPALVLVATVVVGRIYCEVLCPLGVAQDIVRWIFRKKVRRVCTRLPDTKAQLVVKWTVFALFLGAGLAGLSFAWLDPYAIFGRGITLAGGLLFLVLALSAVGKGRFWCNWICPVGTVLQLVSKIAVYKDKVAKCDHCEECGKCFKKD